MLCTPESKILRIYGPIQDKGCWQPRNSEIYNLYKDLKSEDRIRGSHYKTGR